MKTDQKQLLLKTPFEVRTLKTICIIYTSGDSDFFPNHFKLYACILYRSTFNTMGS